jgi:hypothetical protein
MKYILSSVIILSLLVSCKKSNDTSTQDKYVTVKGSVINEKKDNALNQEYWKAGIIFNKTVKASGTATITWYFPAGWINGNPSNHYSKTVNFNINGDTNGYYEFTDWQVDYTMRADSVKITSFNLSSGDYNVSIVN